MGRCRHAATTIGGSVEEILITIGGEGEGWKTLKDCWVMDVKQNKHKKVLYNFLYDHMMIV